MATSAHVETGTPTNTLDQLRDGRLEIVGRLTDASNATFVCDVLPGDEESSEPLRVVYKPIRGERPLDDFPTGTLAAREAAAYVLSEQTPWAIVPPTLLRDGPFGRGAVQLWIDVDEEVDLIEMVMTADDRLRAVALFDALANNADRKGSHLLPTADGHVYGVDHGICFAVEPKLRTVLWAWRGDSLTEDELAVVKSVCDGLDGELGRELGTLLSAAEVRAASRRAEALLTAGTFPQPDPGRPALPWPPF